MALVVVAGRRHLGLPPAGHPAGAEFGVQEDVDLVLEHRRLVGRQRRQQVADPPQFRRVLRVDRPEHRPRAALDEPQAVQSAADRLGALAHAGLPSTSARVSVELFSPLH